MRLPTAIYHSVALTEAITHLHDLAMKNVAVFECKMNSKYVK